MASGRTINTRGGTYVEGDVNSYDLRTQVTQVTIHVLPDADPDQLRVYGASLRPITAPQPPIPRGPDVATGTAVSGATQNGSRNSVPLDVGPHWIVRSPDLFTGEQWYVMGSVLLIPTVAEREIRLRTFGGTAFYEFDVRLTRNGMLEACIWESSGAFVPIASSSDEQTLSTTSSAHRWRFQQFDPSQVLSIGGEQSSAVSFDPGLVQTIWRIRHERETKRAQTYLVALKRSGA